MSRIVFTPVSGSLFHTTRRMVTLSGTAKVMPRSWHSSTSYLSFICTVVPHRSQTSPRASLARPHDGQITAPSPYGSATRTVPHPSHFFRRCSSPCNRPHLHSQLPIEYSMNSSDEFSRKSLIGKTDLKTDCSPASSRSVGRRFICRNRSYDLRCISMRFGIGTVVLIFEKSLRSR